MQAIAVLSRRLAEGCPQMHAMRRRVLLMATRALMQHPRLSISALGRALAGQAKPKHSIKRIDRLVGNQHLMQERAAVYGVLVRWLLEGVGEPMIVVDWSDATPDRRWQLLRAALPVKGRALTLYEEVHPLRHLGNRRVQQRFLCQLKSLLPPSSRPIIVTDAGFSSPWFAAVERLQWSWLGRLRAQEYVRWPKERAWWRVRWLYALARTRPQALGEAQLTQSRPTRCGLFLVRKPKQGRVKRTRQGQRARSKHSEKNAARERQPWLLATSPDLAARPAEQIVALYRRRMQIEEAFRDVKSGQYGLGFEYTQSHEGERIGNLLLIASLAQLLLWLIGAAVRAQRYQDYQSNTAKRHSLSTFHLGLYALQRGSPPSLASVRQILQALDPSVAL